MPDELKVYLDHLIPRESLRYQRPKEPVSATAKTQEGLRLNDLMNPDRVKYLRKPDFQRETWAWTIEDCVSLLESLVNDQVIPSIIMWTSPDNGLDYILDGGHRVSVILAWLNDDWGDNLDPEVYRDEEQETAIKQAARQVRHQIQLRVGTINDYKVAEAEMDKAILAGMSPQRDLQKLVFQRGYFYQRLLKGHVALHVLWASGNYEKAEQSFLKINKSGRQLSDWEIKLVDNRNSSFARVVMSVASISSLRNYWPLEVTDLPNPETLTQKIQEILDGIEKIYQALFRPTFKGQVYNLQQPLLIAPGSHQRPYYLAEFLTVIEGGKGQNPETEKLLSQDKEATPDEIISNGWNLVTNTLDVLEHLVGSTSRSLSIVPALYFYTDSGRYVRSLLYGFIFWLFSGTERDILERKRIFSVYRSSFETILIQKKDDIVTGLTRRTGSGPDITAQTAKYFDDLLQLLHKYHGDISSSGFSKDYLALTKEISSKKPRSSSDVVQNRIFTDRQRSTVVLRELLKNPIRCGICGGILETSRAIEFDHTIRAAQGGETSTNNARLTHPFCNNNRDYIEAIRDGKSVATIPVLIDSTIELKESQLSFFDDPAFNP